MTKDEALKLALEALEEAWYHVGTFQPTEKAIDLYDEARTAIKEALAQPEQELVAWGVFESNLHDMFFTEAEAVEMAQLKGNHAEVKPLYTAPQRTWVGLTAKEKHEFRYSHMTTADFIEDIEAKLKQKNT